MRWRVPNNSAPRPPSTTAASGIADAVPQVLQMPTEVLPAPGHLPLQRGPADQRGSEPQRGSLDHRLLRPLVQDLGYANGRSCAEARGVPDSCAVGSRLCSVPGTAPSSLCATPRPVRMASVKPVSGHPGPRGIRVRRRVQLPHVQPHCDGLL